jgi:hypothetical protein
MLKPSLEQVLDAQAEPALELAVRPVQAAPLQMQAAVQERQAELPVPASW